MTQPIAYPSHTALAGDTDLFIRAVAEQADAAMARASNMSVLDPAEYTINAYGDVTVYFPGLGRGITGAIIYPAKFIYVNGQTTSLPSGGIPYVVGPRYGWPYIIDMNPASTAPGTMYVRTLVQAYSIAANESGPWANCEPAGNGQKVTLCGIGWGPA
jgi:hypothetical protein